MVAIAAVPTPAPAASAEASARAASEECIRFSDLDRHDLARFDFDTEREPVRELPEDESFVIDEITIVRQPIFVSARGEDRWLHRIVNALHSETRESAIRNALVFESGERVLGRTVAESERELRGRNYLYDARVIPRVACNGRLDVDVVVRDVWTLLPEAFFQRSGGINEYTFGLTDISALGTGKTVALRYQSDEDRSSTQLLYEDPNLFGSRVMVDLELANAQDGAVTYLAVAQPFYALETTFSSGGHAGRHRLHERLFFRSEEIATFAADRRSAELFAGISEGVREGIVLRWLTGIRYDEDVFSTIPDRVAPAVMPADRRRIYPWIGVERIRPEYARDANVDHIYRTEDVFIGTELAARMGYADDWFGADSRRVLYRASLTGGRLLAAREQIEAGTASDRHLVTFGVALDGEWALAPNRIEQLLARAQLRYRYRQSDHFSVSATARLQASRNLPVDRQLLLGGDTGLRGYPNRYQVGDRSWLVTIEQRYFSPAYPLRLFRIGGALFFDVGRAWFPGDPDDDGYGVLANVGAGLRIDPTRIWRDRVVHLDFSVPLRDGPHVRSWEITLTARATL
jgi:hypothetical protein